MSNNAVSNNIDNEYYDNNILNSIKKLLGLRDNTAFDQDILIHINTVFSGLQQMGVGPANGFRLEDGSEVWSSFITETAGNKFHNVKDYVFLKVKMLFDPPQNSALIDSFDRQIKELEYRLYTQSGGY